MGPPSPDTEFWVFLVEVGHASNRVGVVKPFDTDPFVPGVTFHWEVPSEEPIQSVEWVPQKYVPPQTLRQPTSHEIRLSVTEAAGEEPGSASQGDSGVQCG